MLPSDFRQGPTEPPSIKKVWLLNAIPFLGAGYLYATKEKGLRLMLFVWALEAVYFSPTTMIWVYFILSILGTAHIIKENRTKKLSASYPGYMTKKDVRSIESGKQIPYSADGDDLSVSKRQSRAMKKAAQKAAALKYEEDEKSKRATDLFEHKLAAAEKMIQARTSAAGAPDVDSDSDFRPDDAADFDDDDEDKKTVEAFFAAPSAVPEDNPFGGGLPAMDLSADTPSVVPDVSSMIANSAMEIPDVSTQYPSASYALPKPELTVQSANSSSFSSIPSPIPPTSIGADFQFEAPKFSFSFDDHESPVVGSTSSSGSVPHCPKCNAVKDSNFSFCLACGQNF